MDVEDKENMKKKLKTNPEKWRQKQNEERKKKNAELEEIRRKNESLEGRVLNFQQATMNNNLKFLSICFYYYAPNRSWRLLLKLRRR